MEGKECPKMVCKSYVTMWQLNKNHVVRHKIHDHIRIEEHLSPKKSAPTDEKSIVGIPTQCSLNVPSWDSYFYILLHVSAL